MSKQSFMYIALITLLFSLILFLFPEIDLTVSHWFYQPGRGFFLAHHFYSLTSLCRDILVRITVLFLAAVVTAFILGFFSKKTAQIIPAKICLFVLLCFALAPGLVVNEILKNHWGRARPIQVQEFGGTKTFTPAWQISTQCSNNCSFISGETANIFCYLALVFIFPRKRLIFTLVMIAGIIVSLERLAQGHHFLSDVVLSGLIDYLLIWLIYHNMNFSPYLRRLQC